MALTKQEKSEVINLVSDLLSTSKMTVMATYKGTTVKAIQDLRRQASQNGTSIHVVKNRLFVKALEANDQLKHVDTSAINGQLLYAFNSQDEVAPAKTLEAFARLSQTLEFVGAITADGTLLNAADVTALASLPTKDQLRGQLVGTLAAPLTGFIGVMSGNLRGILYALNARAQKLGA